MGRRFLLIGVFLVGSVGLAGYYIESQNGSVLDILRNIADPSGECQQGALRVAQHADAVDAGDPALLSGAEATCRNAVARHPESGPVNFSLAEILTAEKQYAEAAGYFLVAAEKGNVIAEANLGSFYYYGVPGIARDIARGVDWYRNAGGGGDRPSQEFLGHLYRDGDGTVPADPAEAAAWYEMAANQGSVASAFELGVLYFYGVGVPHDEKRGFELIRSAAVNGYSLAQTQLGWMYATARGTARNDVLAASWYRKAADRGDMVAQGYLGIAYLYGRGVPQDDAQAARWSSRAAEIGNADAMVAIGWLYENGRGVPKNDGNAAAWYRKSADAGNANGQYDLGVMYDTGRGVPRDRSQAIVWYRKAAAQGSQLAQDALAGIDRARRVETAPSRAAAQRVDVCDGDYILKHSRTFGQMVATSLACGVRDGMRNYGHGGSAGPGTNWQVQQNYNYDRAVQAQQSINQQTYGHQ